MILPQIFLGIFDEFSKFRSVPLSSSALKHHQYMSKGSDKKKSSLAHVQLVLNSFLDGTKIIIMYSVIKSRDD